MKKRSLSSREKDLLTYEREDTLTEKTKNWLDLQSDLFWYKASDRFQIGVSDILVCVRGVFVAIELKSATGKPSPHQLLFIEDVIRAGGIGGVCNNMAKVKGLIEQARNKASKLEV